LEGAVNDSKADGYVRQRVAVVAGKEYTFSAWVGTWMRENNTWKYDVWQDRGRLSWVRLGVDPTGGTDAAAATVQWTPRFYSHRRMSNVAKSVMAASGYLTVFVRMEGQGGQWHLFGVDDCVLTETPATPPEMAEVVVGAGGEVTVRVKTGEGLDTTVEFSTDLEAWQMLTNGISQAGQFEATDPGPSVEGRRFYRARVP
jgi:hypothetical protein